MRKSITFLLSLSIALIGLSGCKNKSAKKELPRIAITGIAIESSMFSPALTTMDAFNVRKGDTLLNMYPFFRPDSGIVNRATWLPLIRANAMPGGVVTRETYETLVTQSLEMLKNALPLDGLFFDIHGAMSVEGMDDPEGDFIVRIREVVGTDVMISTCMDLHGSVSPRLAQNTDLITCYRLAPHDDTMESKKRAVTNLLD